ncbi:MAG TPA: DUF3617 family protein [Vicinamibacterales bacterium]|jgi:hypothetical protein
MHIRKLALAALCSLAVPLALLASPVKPGKWETTVETTVGDRTMPAHTITHCVTPEEASHLEKTIPQNSHSECTMSDIKVDGGTVSWKMDCAKTQMKGEGSMTYSGDSYTGSMHITSPRFEVKTKYSGKYLGACDGQ